MLFSFHSFLSFVFFPFLLLNFTASREQGAGADRRCGGGGGGGEGGGGL